MNDTRAQAEDMVLARLRADFPGHSIWRATRYDGKPGDWVATLHNPAAGIEPTVMRSTPSELRAALINERERALARDEEAR
ncbi:hypothetical protein ACSNOI_08435 [Actinomadura kijaniata]|uniref:hypothetical protein n=1 Tax=Actinomadura kijaniata TaxID=46161 RepID=UPI003F1AD71D